MSEGWSVSQKEAIREIVDRLLDLGALINLNSPIDYPFDSDWKIDYTKQQIIDKALSELEAITKGSEQ